MPGLFDRKNELPTYDELMKIHEMLQQQWGIPGHTYWEDPAQPFDPRQQYDYLSALRSPYDTGQDPETGEIHWPSKFKSPTHPTRYTSQGDGLFDRATGQMVDPTDRDSLLNFLTSTRDVFGTPYEELSQWLATHPQPWQGAQNDTGIFDGRGAPYPRGPARGHRTRY